MAVLNNNGVLFSERQRFNQWWLWLILLLPNVTIGYGIWEQYKSGEPLSWSTLLLSNALLLVVLGLFLLMRLETEIREDGIYVRFFPFASKLKRYGWEDIDEAYVRKYSPLLDYGGWGVRYGLKGRALNVAGNTGIQLKLKDGSRLLIGTRKPEEAKAVLERIRQFPASV